MKAFYDEMTWPEVKRAAEHDRVALVPVGSVEDHGWALPVMTDNLIITSICNEVGRRTPEDVVVLPTAPYGFEAHHMDFAGSIDVHYSTLINMWTDIGKSLAHHGFKKIIFLNGHGSNASPLDLAARQVNLSTESICCCANWWSLISKEGDALRESVVPGGACHGGEFEASVVMYLRPDLVDKRYLEKILPPGNGESEFIWRDLAHPSPVKLMNWYSRYSPTGQIGDQTVASAEKGEKLFEAAVDKVVRLVKEVRSMEVPPRYVRPLPPEDEE